MSVPHEPHSNESTAPPPDEDWKSKAPYRVHGAGDGFEAKLEGGCHCGRVRYQLSRAAPLDSKLCHCVDCQVQHAAPYQWAAIFHKDDINFLNGVKDLEWYDPTSRKNEHRLPCKVRCSFCRSPIMDEGKKMILLFPSLIDLKSEQARKDFRPKVHMFYDQRVIDVPDGLPKWRGMKDQSELIEEKPSETIKSHERNRATLET